MPHSGPFSLSLLDSFHLGEVKDLRAYLDLFILFGFILYWFYVTEFYTDFTWPSWGSKVRFFNWLFQLYHMVSYYYCLFKYK